MEDNPDPGLRTLHVIGRTYSQPHKYFYRRYTHQMWTPWEPVTAEIEGDHLAPVVWRDRLYLFWVTFMEKAKPRADNIIINFKDTVNIPATVEKEVEAELHWSEYLKGEWSTRESGGFDIPDSQKIKVNFSIDSRTVFIHISKDKESIEDSKESGEEGGVYINLSWPFNQAFYLAGRNSTPEKANYMSIHVNPYTANLIHATRYSGNDALKVTFTQRITTEDNKQTKETSEPLDILGSSLAGSYTLLPCNNDINLGNQEIASLVKPLFYQDNSHTLFIEPNLEEQTIEEWQEWITRTPQPEPEWVPPDKWQDFVRPMIPELKPPILVDPEDPVWHLSLEQESLVKLQQAQDWLVNPATLLMFDDSVIGSAGRTELAVLSSADAREAISRGGMPVNILAGSEVASNSTAVALEGSLLKQQGSLVQNAGTMNIVGSSGFNSAMAQNFDALKRFDFGTGKMGNKLIER